MSEIDELFEKSNRRTPFELVSEWYDEGEVKRAIERSGSDEFGTWEKIPEDVHSAEFAVWLTHLLRLAMARGVVYGWGSEKP